MSATRKPNPPSVETARALDDARTMRQKRTAEKEARVLKMASDGVSQRDIANAMGVSRNWVQKALAKSTVMP